MIKVKDGYAKLIGTTYLGSASRVLLSNGGDHVLGNASGNIPLNNGTVNTNLNADLLDGLHIHTGRNNEANKIVRTNANGYIQAGWINTTSGNFTGTPTKIYASNDDYIRYMTPANFFPLLTNTDKQLDITIGGLNRKLTVSYATLANLLNGALVHMCSLYATNTYKAYKITTNWHKSWNAMPTINIRGYAYGSLRTIDCDIVIYHYNNKADNYSFTNKGSYPIKVWQAVENDVLVFYIDPGEYYGMFNVFVYGGMGTDKFTGWVMAAVESVSGTEIPQKEIASSITGNAATATKVYVNQHTGNDTEYPLVWSNQQNNTVSLANLLFKSYSNLTYNPKHNRITATTFRSGSSTFLNGALELYGGTPYIDFHYNNSTSDYTSRIIEGLEGLLTVTGKLRVGLAYNTSTNYKFYVNGSTYSSSLDIGSKAIIDSNGYFYPADTNKRTVGVYGVYDSYKVGHVWSMGTGYKISDNGSNTGNIYGLVYFHTNWSNSSTNNATKRDGALITEVSSYAGSHLVALAQNGKIYASLGDYVWSRNGFKKNGSSDSYVLLGGGGHKSISSFQTTYDSRYVIKTGDTMTGRLLISTTIKDHSLPTDQCFVINSTAIPEGTTLTLKNSPGIGFHIASRSWGSLVFNGTFNFINNDATSFMSVKASKFITSEGTSSQFVKGDGSLDSNTYATTTSLGNYLPLAGGTMNNGAIVKFNANGSIIQTTATTSTATALILWYKGTAKDANYSHAAQIGWHNTGDSYGAIYLVPNPQNSDPWGGSVGLYIGKTLFKWNNNTIIHTGNYTTYTVTKTGSGASGTWGINITGNANTANYLKPVSPETGAKFWYYMGQPKLTDSYDGSSSDYSIYSYPKEGTYASSSNVNIQNLRLQWSAAYFHDLFASPNARYLWHRDVSNTSAHAWSRIVEEDCSDYTRDWNISIAGRSGRTQYLETQYKDNTNWHGDNYKAYLKWETSTVAKLTIDGYDTKTDYSVFSDYLKVVDVRGTNHLPNSSTYPEKYITAWFNNTGTPDSSWWSGITVKGWTSDYSAWLLCSYSSTGTANNYRLYHRNGINSGWGSWKAIAYTSEIPTVTNYYWANVKVSASSSTGTTPTFSTCYTSNWFRSTGTTGWYSESYGGGWHMTDSTWIRSFNNKPVRISVSTYPSIECNAASGSESNLRFAIAGAVKGYVGFHNSYGTFLYNSAAAKYVYINNNGYFYTLSYINVGAGNEKNASNPPYVWGVNGSDNFMRTYATSSLSVGNADYAISSPAAANWGTRDSTTKIKIKINSTTSWMLSFVVTLYQGYKSSKIMISGYNYSTNYWYEPEAVLLGDSNGATSITVYFGYDSANNLWVGFDGGSYTGVSISDVTNGYTQISSFKGLFTISNVSSLTTLQKTVTATNSVNYAATATSATKSGSSDWLNTNTKLEYGASGLNYFNFNGTAKNDKSNCSPEDGYYHILRMNHANKGGYLVDIAAPLNNVNGIYWRQIRHGVFYGWYKLIDDHNYSGILDSRYVNVSGDTMTGDLKFGTAPTTTGSTAAANTRLPSHIYRNVYDTSGNVYDHYYNTEYKASTNSLANLRVKSGSTFKTLSFGGNGTFTWNGNTVWHAGNDGSGSGLDADTVDGLHVSKAGNTKPWGTIVSIGTDGVSEMGRYIDFHYDNTPGSDYSTRLLCSSVNNIYLYLPSLSGTLALIHDIDFRLDSYVKKSGDWMSGTLNFGDNIGLFGQMAGGTDHWEIKGSGTSDNGRLKIQVHDNATTDAMDFEFVDWSGDVYRPLTMTGLGAEIIAKPTPGSWISGKTEASIKYQNLTAIDSNSFWKFYNMKSLSGNVVCYGGLGNTIGFYGYYAATTANRTDWSFTVNTANGNWTASASLYAAHFYENSDEQLKTNIQEILNSDKMPIIKEFDWKEDNSHSYGLIAQELEEQGYSELVSIKDDGYKTVNYSAALSLIVGKLQVKIKELEKEIENLKNKN